jgi:hypothetical protein
MVVKGGRDLLTVEGRKEECAEGRGRKGKSRTRKSGKLNAVFSFLDPSFNPALAGNFQTQCQTTKPFTPLKQGLDQVADFRQLSAKSLFVNPVGKQYRSQI